MKSPAETGLVLDDILEEVGPFSRYQIVTVLLVALPILASASTTVEYVFTSAKIRTRCLIPQCESMDTEFSPAWIHNAIPSNNITSFNNCKRFTVNNTADELNDDASCPAYLFKTNETTACQEYVYENNDSVVFDFKLACNEWKRSQIGSLRTIGTLLVLPITGYISDRWGRRLALTINAFNTAWIGLARSFANSYEWFLALELLEPILGGGTFSSCYILVMELVGAKNRVIASATVSSLFALGLVILGIIAWFFQQWRMLTRVLYIPQFIIILYFWVIPESLRWLMSKKRYQKSMIMVQKMAQINRRQLSQHSLISLQKAVENMHTQPSAEKDTLLPIQVFRNRAILWRAIVTSIWWISTLMIYYGMSINAVVLSGNRYLNFMIVSAIEIPGFWIAAIMMNRVGRKVFLIIGFWVCGVCQFAFAFMPEGYPVAHLVVYLIGKCCISGVMTSAYVYTAELYPTKHRHSLLGFSSMMGRIGSIVAPLTPALASEVWESLPSVLFGSLSIISGLLIFTTPETLGARLPETMEDV